MFNALEEWTTSELIAFNETLMLIDVLEFVIQGVGDEPYKFSETFRWLLS